MRRTGPEREWRPVRSLEDTGMRRSLIAVMVAGAVGSIVAPAQAQAPSPAVPLQWPWPQQAYVGTYPFPSTTPSDAYKQGLISRWELERFEGPTPQALQGPSPNGGNAAPGTGGM
jgi:hypothetical protein